MKQRFLPFLFILSLAILQACKKDKDTTPKEQETVGVYVLYEGQMGGNNSGIAYYDFKTGQSDADYFKTVNGLALGETANDLQQYGNKLYCVVSGIKGAKKSFVEVINPATGKRIKQISFNSDTEGYLPRYIAFYKNKAYVSAYDGKIRRIDTASLAIDGQIETGGAMEGIAVSNNKLYVANSDHYQYSNAATKNTVSVIDLATFTKIKDIPVYNNPQKIVVLKNFDLYLTAWGIFGDNTKPAACQRISSSTDAVTATHTIDLSLIAPYGSGAIAFAGSSLKLYDYYSGQTGKNVITDNTNVLTPYGIAVNELNGDIFAGDANGYSEKGRAFVFNAEGKLLAQFETGAGPNHAVFIFGDKQ